MSGKHGDVISNQQKEYFVVIHLQLPPSESELPLDTPYVIEPSSFFSVMWPNLFRTLYAGVGSWYTLMSYNVFFSEHHRFVLMDSMQDETRFTKFLSLLQTATPHPIWRYSDVQNAIFRAGILGIDK